MAISVTLGLLTAVLRCSATTDASIMLPNALPFFLILIYFYGLLLARVPLTSAMANKAKPLYVKSQELWIKKEVLIARAVEEYRGQTGEPGSREWMGYRFVTNKVMDD